LLAATALPPIILLEDANDLSDFLEFTGKTIPRRMWASEAIAAAEAAAAEALAESLF
jgi:hypothetical protein